MKQPEPMESAHADELISRAQESGAEVLRGVLRHPTWSGSWQLGTLDLSDHLEKYRDHELVIVIASVGSADTSAGKAGETPQVTPYACRTCGAVMNRDGECPRCKREVDETTRYLQARQQRDTLFSDIERVVRTSWEHWEPDSEEGEPA